MFLGAVIVWATVSDKLRAAKLAEMEAEWNVRHPEYVRLSRAEQRLGQLEVVLAELEGSWLRDIPVGSLLEQCVRPFPDSISVGKISLESTYAVDAPIASRAKYQSPHQTMQAVIAGRCFSPQADREIFALLDTLQSSPAITQFAQSITLEGVQKNEAREYGFAAHTVFALRVKMAERSLEQESP